ncbi:PAS domain S-box protein [Shewanella livingstonensis]|uniref:Sensory/regulatory protein RpfC n=1 Tax=Shewanella livingstonensis TaxID=150120 RepID=A0A3G8LXH6_9GAMM|nr:PAS domain S-box protein [Shewanella livingstonensis]AZG74114.1 PAS domain S-box protein [Shewanella livingstonensis]
MTKLSSYKNALKLGIGVFAFGLVISFVTALSVKNQNNDIITKSLKAVTEQVANNIIDRIVLYQYGLRGARGAVSTIGEDNITREIFSKYSSTRDIESEFPGARGFGYIRRVPKADEADFVAKAKMDDWPDYSVRQLNPHDDERYLIDYIEPVERNVGAVGLDIASEENRKNAAQQAYLTGEVRLTGPITLVQATGHPLQAFLILMPIYRTGFTPSTPELREQNAFGWSYAPLVANEVFDNINLSRKTTKIFINDVSDDQNKVMFYETHVNDLNPLSSFFVTLEREIFGRKWQVSLLAYPEFISGLHLTSPKIVFSYGVIFSLLLGGFVGFYGYALGRKRMIIEDNERRANILEHSLDAIISFDCDGVITSWNDGAITIFGYEKSEVIGLKKTTFIVPNDGIDAENEQFNQVLSGKSLLNFISQHKRKDNELLSTSMTSLAIYNEFGKIIGVSQTIRDITIQLNAEKQILSINASLERKVTARTHALQQALSENKTLLDNINQQLLYSETDKNGVILAVNDYFCITSGFTREQMIGNNHSIVKSNEHDDAFWKNMWQTINSGQTWHDEICNRDSQGNIKWLDTVIAPVMDQSGNLDRCIALRIDITERKNSQLEKNKLGSLLTNVLAAATEIAIISTGNDGIITMFNRGAELLLGYKAEEIVGKQSPAIMHVPAEVHQRSIELSEEFGEEISTFDVFVYKPRTQGPETRTWTYIRKDFTQCQVSLSVSAMRDQSGEIIGYLGVAVNIDTMLKQQEELVSASNQLIKAAEVAELGIWNLDLDTNDLQWNDRMFAMYDYPLSLSEEGLNYQHWQRRIHPDDVDMATFALQQAINLNIAYDPIFRVITRSNQVRYIQAGAQISYDKLGKPVRVVGINRDITEQRELEQTLRLAKQAADAASAAKSAFLANMSHEIRTPMNAVLGMLQLIQHSDMSRQQVDYVTKAEIAAKSLLGLLNDILDFSKIDAGKLELDLHPFQLETLMRELAVMLATNGHNKNIEVIFDLDPAIPYLIEGDELRLRQVLLNLAGNAIKFTAEGHVIVSVHCNESNEKQVNLTISITDTGIGISAEQGDKIFQGFVQAESSTSRRFGGTGLGLAITKRLVELMGGELTLKSHIGEGSRFWFDLTFNIVEVKNSDVDIDLLGKNILLVDDSKMSRKILSKTLMAHGAYVNEAHNSKQAINLIDQSLNATSHYDVIIMDWRMPDMNGLETANHIQSMFAAGKAPAIIMLTAYGAEVMEQTKQYSHAPFVSMLTKPVTANLMLEAVYQAINGLEQPLQTKKITQLVLKDVRVLVVEDNQLNRQVIDELLRLQGAIVTLANDGIEGVDWVTKSNNQFDIVIMDMQMPVMDGLEATRLIRADGRFNDLSILAMTANASLADKALCLEAGMNEHIGKPIDMALLLPCMLNLLTLEDNTYYHSIVDNQPIGLPEVLSDSDDDVIIEDPDSILRRFGGELAFFIDVKHHFAAEMSEQLSMLTQAFEQQNNDAISSIAHTIKGTASNLGAKRLAAFAAMLEQNINNAINVDSVTCLSQMQSQINDSLHMLDTLFPDESAVLTASPLDNKAALPIQSIAADKMNHLMELLLDQNLDAIEYLERLLNNVAADKQWLRLKNQVSQLEFLDAIDTLKSIIKE